MHQKIGKIKSDGGGKRGRRQEEVDGGEEDVQRSSFKGMWRTVDEKWHAGKAECQLAGSTVKMGV